MLFGPGGKIIVFSPAATGSSRKTADMNTAEKKQGEMVLEMQSRALTRNFYVCQSTRAHDTVGKVQLVETGDIVFLNISPAYVERVARRAMVTITGSGSSRRT